MKRTLAIAALLLVATPALAQERPVHAKPKSGYIAGIVLTSLSGAFLVGGVSMVAVATGMQNSFSSWGTSLLVDAGAFAMFGGSIGFGVSGIYLLAANAPSHDSSLGLAPRAFAIPVVSGSF